METKIINLFIACSATSELLNAQKEALLKKCKELNTKLAEEGQSYKINPIAYEDLERRVKVFKKHIKNDDIVVFLIDDTKDNSLEQKLKVASKSYDSGSKPELLVFMSDDIDEITEKRIKDILKTNDWLYENLDNNFLTNVEKRIRGYIGQCEILKKKKRKQWKRVIIVVSIIFLIAVFFAIKWYKEAETRRLLIVGGGSARAYIEESILHQKRGLSTKYWLYAPMPSGDAYRMMAEEVINIDTNYRTNHYYPIIISAGRAKGEADFRRTISKNRFIKKGVVIGIKLGDDYLTIYSSQNEIKHDTVLVINDTMQRYALKAETLNRMIAKQNSLLRQIDTSKIKQNSLSAQIDTTIFIYTTSANSGTLNTYINHGCDSLNTYISLCRSKELERFFSDIDIISQQKNKWIALGSEYYYPYDKKNDEEINTAIVIDDKVSIKKPVFIYFMLYKDKDAKKYKLPNATEKFLREIHINTNTIDSIKENIGINDTIILYDNYKLYYDKGNKLY